MDRVFSSLLRGFPVAGLARRARAAALAGLAAALVAAAPALARQSLEIDGELAPEVEEQLSSLVQSAAASANGVTRIPALRRQLLALLRSEGYYGAAVRTGLTAAEPVFYISPGLRFSIGDVRIETTPNDPAAVAVALSAAQLAAGAPLRAQDVITGEARARAALQENGWPDAAVLERHVSVDHDTALGAVTLRLDAGPYSHYGAVQVVDDEWRESFIRRLSPLEQGEMVQLSGLQSYQARLTALDSVGRASVALADTTETVSQERDVIVRLSASPRNALEAGFGLSTSEGGGVGATWIRRNLFGGDETLRLSAKLLTLEQSVETQLSAPHWRRLDQTLTLIAVARNEETDAFEQQEIGAEVDITRRLSPRWSSGVYAGVDLSRLRTNSDPTDIALLFAGVSAVYDRRDSVTDPTAGVRASFQITPALAFGDLNSTYVLGETTLRTYRRLGERFIAAARLRVGGLAGASIEAIPVDERFYAGGGGSVRGYEYQSLSPTDASGQPTGGRSVVEASAELRWRGPGRWGGAVFADTGLASSDVRLKLEEMRVGIGAGVRYHFDFAPIRLDVAVPVDRRADEASFHFYVSLGQAF
jgi:translocation and assembly module TamA